MKYKTLGRTDLDVSLICLGTMTWGRQNTEAEGHEQMDYALEQGVNFFDTAELYAVPPNPDTYGKTEAIIGTWFNKTGNRDKVILASKVAGPGMQWIRGGGNMTSASIKAALDDSLKRLQTDYIDLYQLHWPNRGGYHFSQHWDYAPKFDKKQIEEDFINVLETLETLVKAGKIRHIGLSNETAWGVMKWLRLSEDKALPRMASIQNEYSLLNRMFDTDLHEIAMAEDCGLLAWSPLGGGLLSGKYLDGARPKGSRWDIDDRFLQRDTQHANNAVKAYIALAETHGLDICQMALAFVNQQPFVTSNIIGATNMAQLKNNIASIDLTLSQEVLAGIAKIHRQFPMVY
ncbi:MAG: aldo/keto reductase [Zetaproteobacteria bacterium]|nr:MAG: aldo/keto reductase [Zetaproteobacteria bacterium]